METPNLFSKNSSDSSLMTKLRRRTAKAAVIGINPKGLEIAVELSYKMPVILYDDCVEYVQLLQCSIDPFAEWGLASFNENITFTSNPADLSGNDFYIISVDNGSINASEADIESLRKACRAVATHMPHGASVIFEEKITTAAIEGVCMPILEKLSGYNLLEDFYIGFVPALEERLASECINSQILFQSQQEIADAIQRLYSYIPMAGEKQARESARYFLNKEWTALAERIQDKIPGIVLLPSTPNTFPGIKKAG